MNPLQPRIPCGKFGLICSSSTWEENLKFCKFFFWLFRNYLPLEIGGALHLNKLESPSPKNALSQGWLKLVQWFLKRRFFNFVDVFSLFRNYLPLEKNRDLHLISIWVRFTKRCIVTNFVEIGPVVLEKKIFKFCQYIVAIS